MGGRVGAVRKSLTPPVERRGAGSGEGRGAGVQRSKSKPSKWKRIEVQAGRKAEAEAGRGGSDASGLVASVELPCRDAAAAGRRAAVPGGECLCLESP